MKDINIKCNHGIFIDVFPLDNLPDSPILRQKTFKKMWKYLSWIDILSNFKNYKKDLKSYKQKIKYYLIYPFAITKVINKKIFFILYNNAASKYKRIKTKEVGIICCFYDNPRFIFNSDDFDGKTIKLDFEDIKISAPEKYDSILKKTYKDYMTPVIAKSEHGDTIFDTKIPYNEYLKKCRKIIEAK